MLRWSSARAGGRDGDASCSSTCIPRLPAHVPLRRVDRGKAQRTALLHDIPMQSGRKPSTMRSKWSPRMDAPRSPDSVFGNVNKDAERTRYEIEQAE